VDDYEIVEHLPARLKKYGDDHLVEKN